MSLCAVSGNVVNVGLAAVSGVIVRASATSLSAFRVGGSIVLPTSAEAASDSDGDFTLNLAPGEYRVEFDAPDGSGSVPVRIVVPDLATASFEQIIDLPASPDITAAEQAKIDAVAAAAAASASAAEAADTAANVAAGDSAYQIAVDEGFVGTEAEWLASLVGPQGDEGPQGPKGDTGDTGPQGSVGPQGEVGPVGPEGPQGPQGLKGDKGDTGSTGPEGPQGPQGLQGEVGPEGPQGDEGWSPVLAIVTDGARRVAQIVDWTGGEGTKPATGSYIGATGLEALIGDAIDIRGPAGADGAGSGDMTAATYDPQSISGDAFARGNHTGAQAISTVTGLQAALDGKAAAGDVFSGAYADLTGKPTLGTAAASNTGDFATAAQGTKADTAHGWGNHANAGYITSVAWGDVNGKPNFATVATSGSYNDLANLPTLFSGAYGDLTGVPSSFPPSPHSHAIADVTGLQTALDGKAGTGDVFSGAYADLTGKPTIPAAANDATITVSAGTGLTGGGNFTTDQSGNATITVNVDKATAGNVRSRASNKVVTADGIRSALARVSYTSATFAPDFNGFESAEWTLSANGTLANPTNVPTGASETKQVWVKGNNSTERAVTFGTAYKGDLPSLSDVTSSKWYLLTLVSYSPTHIVVTEVVALS